MSAVVVGGAQSAWRHPHAYSHIGGKVHDANIVGGRLIEAGAFSVMDCGYIDFERLPRRANPFAQSNLPVPLFRCGRAADLKFGPQPTNFMLLADREEYRPPDWCFLSDARW